ncbi:MAG: homoserine kinase [Deltaproteobacteria bacterium]|nr:homoserine kinase [Deltaproteobacteria bacterium]
MTAKSTAPESAIAYAPATVANVAAGFDIMGFAVRAPGDEVTARLAGPPGVRIASIDGDGGALPREAQKNTAGVAALGLLSHVGSPAGVEIELRKRMPLGSGLGSSAASAAAAAVAVNELLGRPLNREALLPFCMEAERTACGAAHADNAAPALLGGFVLIRSCHPLDIVRIPVPEELACAVVHPHIEIRTEDARMILRNKITMKEAITQWGNTAGLIAGLTTGDYDLIGRSLNDVVIEPVRAILIPGFHRVKEAAAGAGALGCSISGSGPSIFALARGVESARKAGGAMSDVYREMGVECDLYVSEINRDGTVLE